MNEQPSPPKDRFCDLVMKGGVTSGIVYPKAISRLAAHYHFKNIGGSSAGAIAAAVTAAAEYQRRRTSSMAGFERLARLPDELGQRPDQQGPSRLLRLFQPQQATQRLFSVLVLALNRGGTWRRVFHIVRGLLLAYWAASLAALVLAVAAGMYSSLLAGVLTFVLACTGLVLWGVYRDVTRRVTANGFGLCTGMSESGHADPALTPWLHDTIQQAAGRTPGDPPLTFGDLWNAPGFPPEGSTLQPTVPPKSIHLQMFTTNLSHGRPYVLPFEEGDPQRNQDQHAATQQRLFYRQEELARYLPHDVLAWLTDHSQAYELSPGRASWDPATTDGQGLLELPAPRDFPILLAARMSLSFPLLFAAVPLWAIDYDAKEGVGRRSFKRCWFSDGGLSSNFPIHMFDGLVPAWPTFGITLEPKLPGRANMTFLPTSYYYGYGERWQRFDEQGNPGSRMGGFLSALVNTMQEWNDNTLSRMPGVRDRVVRLRLHPQEGGLNLNMPTETITSVSSRGLEAADDLIRRYLPSADTARITGWDEQRWVRLNVFLRMLEKRLPGVRAALEQSPASTDWEALIDLAGLDKAAGFDRPITADEAQALRAMCALLKQFADDFMPLAQRLAFVAIPEPELRVRPAL
ncbi:MAG: patatin-like phospholipase family protein [Polaromonas sp.]|nr:patatin-like phospholipase family protein [Polaromonas sp.]